MRVALYARVSTEEQARSGLSIDTQLDNLRRWAAEHGHVVVGEYVDPGISARKAPLKRPALQRLLGDLDKIEAVAFTKLDRWTRNVRGYYQVQEQLDAHKVAWIAIQEDYETVTSAGRFKVNIMLAVAESEADRTSERIRVVFDRKIEKGEYIGTHVPLGFAVRGKRLVLSDDAPLVREVFAVYRRTGSVYQAKDFLHAHGHTLVYPTVHKMLRNPMYAGRYRDNPDYCPAIIPPAEFDAVQRLMEKRSVRRSGTRNVYLFSGLLRCSVCGHNLGGNYVNARVSLRYRCPYHAMNAACPNARNYREIDIESWLLDNLLPAFARMEAAMKAPKTQKKPVDRAAIQRKIDRLTELYVDELIDKEKYAQERAALLAQLPDEDPAPRDLSQIRDILMAADFRDRYASLSREDKRALWRSIVDHIDADPHGNLFIYFLP